MVHNPQPWAKRARRKDLSKTSQKRLVHAPKIPFIERDDPFAKVVYEKVWPFDTSILKSNININFMQ